MNNELQSMSPDQLREQMKSLASVIAASTGEMAVCLYVVQTKRYWELWDYESLDAFAEEDLAITKAALKTYLRAGRVAATKGLSLEEIKRLGKGKLAALDKLTDNDKFAKAREYANDHTEAALKEYIDQRLIKGLNTAHDRTVKTWSVKMAADDFEEAQRLATMIQLELNSKLVGDGILQALRAYWMDRKSKAA